VYISEYNFVIGEIGARWHKK